MKNMLIVLIIKQNISISILISGKKTIPITKIINSNINIANSIIVNLFNDYHPEEKLFQQLK